MGMRFLFDVDQTAEAVGSTDDEGGAVKVRTP